MRLRRQWSFEVRHPGASNSKKNWKEIGVWYHNRETVEHLMKVNHTAFTEHRLITRVMSEVEVVE